MIKKTGLLLALIFFVTLPSNVNAQTNSDEQYREYLLNIIALLQQQVELLLEAQNIQTVENNLDAKFDSFLIKDEADIKARYFIDAPEKVAGIQNSLHRVYFDRFYTLVPDDFDEYFTEVLIYEERGNDFDGFVETVPPYRSDTWRLGMNESMFEFAVEARVVSELFIHEFAHILSYEGVYGMPSSRSASCHEYYDGFDCPPANSYLTVFADQFWPDSTLDEFIEEGEDIWSSRELQDDFVTDYAATAPGEDFAESFTDFVLDTKPTGSKLKYDKVRFFYEYEDVVDLRNEIRSKL